MLHTQQLPAPHPEQLRLTDGNIVRKVPNIPNTVYCSDMAGFFSVHNAVLTDDGWQMHEYAMSKYKPDCPSAKTGGVTNYIFVPHQVTGLTCAKKRALIVYETWVGPRTPGMQIDHINGDSKDDRVENLQEVTPEENIKRAVILRCLRKAGRDPKQMSREELLRLFSSFNLVDPDKQMEEELSNPIQFHLHND